MGAVSIWELAANSGSSWMSQAPNLHFARQLLTRQMDNIVYIYFGVKEDLDIEFYNEHRSNSEDPPIYSHFITIAEVCL